VKFPLGQKVSAKYGIFEHLADPKQYHPCAQKMGSAAYHFKVIDSTNTFAVKVLSNGYPKAGTIITADFQTAGRGQFGHTWYSSPGLNLTMSCILYPTILPADQFLLSMAVSLAVRDIVSIVVPHKQSFIKWPNDIYVGERKIAGILIQNSIQREKITSCIAGIGLNVNETNFPVDLPNPTSLSIESNRKDLNIMSIQENLLQALEYRLEEIYQDNAKLIDAYHEKLYRRNVRTTFRMKSDGAERVGMLKGVDGLGRILIEWEDGSSNALGFKEIEYG
jgi:BirA family biotin operon repressor/biotin-[acetyl-CoA-carboxylase] ligase